MEVREEGSYAGSSVHAALLPDPETPQCCSLTLRRPPRLLPDPRDPQCCTLTMAMAGHDELRPVCLFSPWLHVDGKVKTKALEQA